MVVLHNYLAAGGDGRVVLVAGGADTQAAGRKGFPQHALVGTSVAVGVGLDPGITSSED